MKLLARYISLLLAIMLLPVLAACSDGPADTQQIASIAVLEVYKSPTCGCCTDWIQYMEDAGFKANVHHPADLDQLKLDNGIAPQLQSCHTAISVQGYVFEGHIPARYVEQFLAHPPPGAIGLSVPAMPLGSPGMEVDDKFTPYKVWLLMQNGSAEIYASVDNPAQQ